MFSRLLAFLCAGFVLAGAAAVRGGEAELRLKVFTDESVRFPGPSGQKEVAYSLTLLTKEGLEKGGQKIAAVEMGLFQVVPEKEGVHIVRLEDGTEFRFLAITPPEQIPPERFSAALPQSFLRLRNGGPYVIGAYGDSVTQTGDYPEILAMLLGRALNRPGQVRVVRRAYPGRSIDATIRHWERDVPGDPPDLALIMYGLNDQAAGLSLDAYLEQAAYLAGRFQKECRADVIFLQPTPHIDVFAKSGESGKVNRPDFAFRTLGFATALRVLTKDLGVGCAETFQAIWQDGGASLLESAERMRPLFPPHYSRQMESMLEVREGGDTIHPNILGHLAIARAVQEALTTSVKNPWPLGFSAISRWENGRPVAGLEVANHSDQELDAMISVHAMPDRALTAQQRMRLKPGERQRVDVAWPGIQRPEDLISTPAGRELAANRGILAVVSTIGGHTRVEGVPARLVPGSVFERKRWETHETSLEIPVSGTGGSLGVNIPPGSESGKIPLLKKLDGGAWAAAALWYVRYAWADSGEARVDGELGEWSREGWIRLGDPHHARWVRGPEDYRASPNECSLKFAFKSGAAGVFMAIEGQGDFSKDDFTLFFDPRAPKALGTPGPYYWVSGTFSGRAQLAVKTGETSPARPQPEAAVRQTAEGSNAEVFIPYAALGISRWPESGDLGFSLSWSHRGGAGKATHLLWSDIGHPWNPRWFGVIRRQSSAAGLPFMVRVE